METASLFWILLFLTLLAFIYGQATETFQLSQLGGGATSPGTLLQLVAKGPQDFYLTGVPDQGFYGYGGYGYSGPISPHYFRNPYGYHYPYSAGYGGYRRPGWWRSGRFGRRRRLRASGRLARRHWWQFWL